MSVTPTFSSADDCECKRFATRNLAHVGSADVSPVLGTMKWLRHQLNRSGPDPLQGYHALLVVAQGYRVLRSNHFLSPTTEVQHYPWSEETTSEHTARKCQQEGYIGGRNYQHLGPFLDQL